MDGTEINNETVEPIYTFTQVESENTEQPKVEETVQVVEEVKSEEPIVATEPIVVEPIVPTEIDEETAFKFLKEKRGLEVNSIDELLTPKEQKKYAPQMEAFNEFIEKTGNTNFNDFLETQKDWSAESSENKLKEFIRISTPDLTKEEQEFLYKEKYGIEDLDPEFDGDEITKKTIQQKTDLKSATEVLEKRKEEFKANGGSDAYIPQEYREAKLEIENQKQKQEDYDAIYNEQREIFLNKLNTIIPDDFKGFKVPLGNEEFGFREVAFKTDNVTELRSYLSDSNNLINEFKDDKGILVKSEEYLTALYFAKNYKTELSKAYNQGIADKAEADDKRLKNIQPDNIRTAPTVQNLGMKFEIAE